MRSLLIDGYNLMHATDLFGQGPQLGTLEGGREALLAFLAVRLTQRERGRTRIVFDAAGAPPGLPKEYRQEGMRVLFARDFADADAMLEALIERSKAPKELLVVSGDRRVQRAARGRGAAWVDSVDWFRELRRRMRVERAAGDESSAATETLGDVAFWVKEFSQELSQEAPQDDQPGRAHQPHSEPGAKPKEPPDSIFPAGYAEDLAEELEVRHPPPP